MLLDPVMLGLRLVDEILQALVDTDDGLGIVSEDRRDENSSSRLAALSGMRCMLDLLDPLRRTTKPASREREPSRPMLVHSSPW